MNKTIVLAVLLSAGSAFGQVKLGVLPRLPPAEMTRMMSPIAKHLEAALGQQVELVIPKDFQTFTKMAKEGAFHLAYSNPSVFMAVAQAGGAEPLAIASDKGTGRTFTGCFLVKQGSPIKKLADIKGKKIIFVDEQSPGGYQSQMVTLKKAGIGKADVDILPFAKKHTNVVLAVHNGTAEVGGIRTADLARIKAESPDAADVVVLAETGPIPNWPFFALPGAPKGVAERAKAAILGLPAGSPVLKELGVEKFEKTGLSDFESVVDLMKL